MVLFIIPMKHNQLLVAMRGVVEGVKVQREVPRRLGKRLNEMVD